MPPAPVLSFRAVSRRFETPSRGVVDAISEFSLDCVAGRLTAIVGPSGCGKTTLLRMAAGLEAPTAGTIHFQGRPITVPSVAIGLVRQEGGLLPWRRIIDNVALPLELRGVGRRHRRYVAAKAIRDVHLPDDVARSYPHELSGGMRRRAALAAALVSEPKILLMDEPFNGVDELTRRRLQRQTLALRQDQGRTILLVTHDVEEAVALADTVVVMDFASQIERLDIDLPHPRDPLSRPFVDRVLRIRRALEQNACDRNGRGCDAM